MIIKAIKDLILNDEEEKAKTLFMSIKDPAIASAAWMEILSDIQCKKIVKGWKLDGSFSKHIRELYTGKNSSIARAAAFGK